MLSRCNKRLVAFILPLCIAYPVAADSMPDDKDLAFHLTTSLGPEYDSNARRVTATQEVVADSLLRAALAIDAAYKQARHTVDVQSSLGLKIFANERAETTSAAVISARYRFAVSADIRAGLEFNARARRLLNNARNYESGAADLYLGVLTLAPLSFEAHLGPRLFVYEPNARYSSVGVGAGLWAQLAVLGREQIACGYEVDARAFPDAVAIVGMDGDGGVSYSNDTRVDHRHSLSLRLLSSRQVYWSTGYSYIFTQSNSLGETYGRHVLSAIIATELPLELFASANISLQITNYIGGLALSQSLLLEDSDESQNKLVFTLKRPLTHTVAIEGCVAFYSNELSDSGLAFSRSTAFVGFIYTR